MIGGLPNVYKYCLHWGVGGGWGSRMPNLTSKNLIFNLSTGGDMWLYIRSTHTRLRVQKPNRWGGGVLVIDNVRDKGTSIARTRRGDETTKEQA